MPLTAATPAAEHRDFRVTVIPQAGLAQPFHALEPVAQGDGAGSPAEQKRNCGPRITLQRDGDRVTNIRIQCSCGQTMDLACVYEERANTP